MKLSSQLLALLAGAQLSVAGVALAADDVQPKPPEPNSSQPKVRSPKKAIVKPSPPPPRPITEDYCPPCGRG